MIVSTATREALATFTLTESFICAASESQLNANTLLHTHHFTFLEQRGPLQKWKGKFRGVKAAHINIHFYLERWKVWICQPAQPQFTPAGGRARRPGFSPSGGPAVFGSGGFRTPLGLNDQRSKVKGCRRSPGGGGDEFGDWIFREGSRSQSMQNHAILKICQATKEVLALSLTRTVKLHALIRHLL